MSRGVHRAEVWWCGDKVTCPPASSCHCQHCCNSLRAGQAFLHRFASWFCLESIFKHLVNLKKSFILFFPPCRMIPSRAIGSVWSLPFHLHSWQGHDFSLSIQVKSLLSSKSVANFPPVKGKILSLWAWWGSLGKLHSLRVYIPCCQKYLTR